MSPSLVSGRVGAIFGVTLLLLTVGLPVDGAALSPNSEERSVAAPGTDGQQPITPIWGKVTVQETVEFGKATYKVVLVWPQVSGAAVYKIYRSTESGKIGNEIGSVADSVFVDAMVEVGKTYFYTLTALDGAARESGHSPEQSATVSASKRPEKKKLIVIPRTTTSLWKVFDKRHAGDEGGLDGLLGDAFDLAYDRQADLLYVSSTFNRRIVVLRGSDGAVLRQFGPHFGDYKVGVPLGLGLDKEGRLYVVDGTGNSVAVLSQDGGLIRVITVARQEGEKQLRLIDVAVGSDGTAFITDNANGQVVAIDDGGREIWRLGIGGGDGQLAGVTKIAITADGDLVVIDGQSQKIHLLSPSGDHLISFGERKPSVDGFLFLSDVAPLDDGHLLTADLGSASLREYSLRKDPGMYVANIANPKGDAGLLLFNPLAIAGDGKDLFFVLDGCGGRVNAFRLGDIRGSQ